MEEEVSVEITFFLPGCHDPIGFVHQDGHVANLGELTDFLDEPSKHSSSSAEVPFFIRGVGC